MGTTWISLPARLGRRSSTASAKSWRSQNVRRPPVPVVPQRSPDRSQQGSEDTPPESPIFGGGNFYPPGGINPNLPWFYQQQPQAMPPVLPEPGPSGNTLPRRSGRNRRAPAPQPGDVYGNRNPLQRQQLDLRTQLPINEDIPVQSSANSPVAPGTAPSSGPRTPPDPSAGLLRYQDLEPTMLRLAHEGGAPFINYLLAQAIQPDNERDKSLPPTVSRVRDWHFQDILKKKESQSSEGGMEEGLPRRIRVPS